MKKNEKIKELTKVQELLIKSKLIQKEDKKKE